MTKLEYQELFLFAAKAGSLEGYLFNRRKVESLDNWITHISEMYRDLSPAVRKEINPELAKEAGKTAAEEANPRSSIRASREYRKAMVEVLTKRAILSACERIRGNGKYKRE